MANSRELSKNRSFDRFLDETPSLDELTRHVRVGNKWHVLGTLLELDHKELNSLKDKPVDDTDKTVQMFGLWLAKDSNTSRRRLLQDLKEDAVGENGIAHKYEEYLRSLHDSTYTVPLSDEAIYILRDYVPSLKEALVSPVQVSQLLYSKGCISEATLDEMERMDQSRSLDGKKTTLLTAIQETVSNDYRKLKDIATVLSDVEETRDVAQKILTEYATNITEEESSPPELSLEQTGDSNENQHASDILRKNYYDISQSIKHPVVVAHLLVTEKLLPSNIHDNVVDLLDNRLPKTISRSPEGMAGTSPNTQKTKEKLKRKEGSSLHYSVLPESLSDPVKVAQPLADCRAVLLKAVRHAVHSNYKHLKLFVTVLRKSSETAHIGDTIFEEYSKCFTDENTIEEIDAAMRENGDTQSSEDIKMEAAKDGTYKIDFPRNMKEPFEEMRIKFGDMFFEVRRSFGKKKNLDIEDVKAYLTDCYPGLESQLECKDTVNKVLEVVKRKCSLIDVRCLACLADKFKVTKAVERIKSYKEQVKTFRNSIPVSLCLEQKLSIVSASRLKCETIIFVLNWEPEEEYTLKDIKDVLEELEPLHRYRIQIDEIRSDRSVAVICHCPAEYISSLIIGVFGKIEVLQKRGLKEFIVGDCTVWASTSNNKVTEEKEVSKARTTASDYEVTRVTSAHLSEKKMGFLDLKGEADQNPSTPIPSEPESNKDLKKQLQTQRSLGKRRSIEIEDLKFNIKEKDEKIAALENDIKTLQNKLQETEKLKATLDNNGHVAWKSNQVSLTNPSAAQCWEVIPKLEGKHETVHLEESSSIIVLLLAPPVLQRESVKSLHLFSTPFRHETIICLSTLLSNNESLRELWIMNCAICGDGFNTLVESLQNNTSLTELNVQLDIDITLTSSESLRQLLRVNHTLNVLHLCGANFGAEGLAILLESLKTNETLKQLYLDKKHEGICSSIPSYFHISDRLVFSS